MAKNDNKKISDLMKSELKAIGKSEFDINKRASRTIGVNGRPIGTILTLTGDIEILNSVDTEGNITGKYFALKVEEPGEQSISLTSLMGVSSLNGYLSKGNPIEINIEINKKVETETVETSVEDLNDYEPFSWNTRNLFDMADYIAEHPKMLRDKKVKYLGRAVKPFTAKKDFPFNGGTVKKGMQRAIETSLWNIGV